MSSVTINQILYIYIYIYIYQTFNALSTKPSNLLTLISGHLYRDAVPSWIDLSYPVYITT